MSVRLRAEAIATALTDSGMGLRKVITQNGGFPCNPEDLMRAYHPSVLAEAAYDKPQSGAGECMRAGLGR